ncbi:MAG TPA: hypothetical protein VGN06_07925 [Gaiellaceae bacterium]|jgi:hypothetical protein
MLQRIETLLDAPATGEAAPSLASLEATLTEGYARALALEAERSRIERRFGEVARTVEPPVAASGAADELLTLAKRLTHANAEIGSLRAVLRRLQARTRALRHATIA